MIAAHPVSVGQYVGILLLPLDALGEVAPECAAVDAVHAFIVVVEFHHARAAYEGAAQFAACGLVIHVLAHLSVGRENEAVG